MKQQINKYINEIKLWKQFNDTTAEYECKMQFVGDGEGDFEESSFDASKECLQNYIRHCEGQMTMAKDFLRAKYSLMTKEIEIKEDNHE